MADPSEVGKFGTIRLLKRKEPSAVVAAYPIDDEEVSFGRDTACSVRLYYQEVSALHCKIVFEDRKAFLQVFGASGVIVDGCPVYPSKPAVMGSPSTTVTIPLPNGSTFEIQKKRFMFNYPPKALRPQLFTPATAQRRKSVRMSVVQSALVFSPAPSPHPRENLRVLQSPVKLAGADAPVTLVDGDHPRVYEEEQDLVILEDVDPQLMGSPHHDDSMRFQNLPPLQQAPPKTPRRRSAPSLHRAVLIRSAQRTAYMRETHAQMAQRMAEQGNSQHGHFEEINLDEDGEEDEEDEVVNSILNADDEDEEDLAMAAPAGEPMEEMVLDGMDEMKEVGEEDEQDITEAHSEYPDFDENDEENQNQIGEIQLTTPLQVSRALHLGSGSFMSPQPGLFSELRPKEEERRKTGPQRPPPGFRFSLAPTDSAMVIKEEDIMDEDMEQNVGEAPTSPSKRKGITEEERKAILERRRSALKAPDFEIGQGSALLSNSSPGHHATGPPPGIAVPASPFKTLNTHIEEGEDTQTVLRRMHAQIAERRASLSPSRPRIDRDVGGGMGEGLPLSSPQKIFSLLAAAAPDAGGPGMRMRSPERGGGMGMGMLTFEEGIREETESQLDEEESMEVDSDEDGDENRENVENDENARPVEMQQQGLAKPSMDGVRELFRERKVVGTGTTPVEGGEMMCVDEDKDEDEAGKDCDEAPEEDTQENEAKRPATTTTRKLPLASRTLVRGKGTRPGPAFIRTKGTPTATTDVSTMADDEATPDSAPVVLPKRLKANENGPEEAVVHRSGRVRRAAPSTTDAGSGSGVQMDSEVPAKTTRRGRSNKAKADESEAEVDEQASAPAPARAAPKSRGRARNADASSLAESDTDVATQSTKRGSMQPGDASAPATRRSTRARSRSADPETQSEAENSEAGVKTKTKAKSVVQTKAVTVVETIVEEEEPVSAKASAPAKKAGATRARRTRTETGGSNSSETSSASVVPKKRAGPSTSSSLPVRRSAKISAKTSAVDSSAGEDALRKEDKENTPERSPGSESVAAQTATDDIGAGSGVGAAKGKGVITARGRAAAAASASRTKAALRAPGVKAGAGTGKPPSKTRVKSETEEENVTLPRATRARARK